MASKVSGIIEKIQPGGSSGTAYAIASTAYGYCETAAGTAAKTVDMTDFKLYEGVTIHVKFANANSADNPTLNVNSTGAKAIVQYGTTAAGKTSDTNGWYAGAVLTLTYDGTSWVRDQGFNSNSTYSYMRPYGSTAGATAEKIGTAGWKFQLTAGKYFMFTQYYDNTAQSALTLNIGSTGAKTIYINGQPSSASNYILPGGQYLVYYDGTNYYFRTDDKMTGNITGNAATASSVALSGVTGADDLKAIEAISGTTGLLKKTAANTWTLDTTAYTTNKGTVTSVQVQASSPLQSSTNTAQNTTLSTTISFTNQNKNLVLAGPSSGNAAAPSFRALVAADIPALAYVPVASNVSNDINTYYNTGIYNITTGSLTNGPVGYGFGQLLVMSYRKPSGNTTTDWATQLYSHLGSGNNGNTLYYRTSNASTWQTWQMAIHADAGTTKGSTTTPVYVNAKGEIQEGTALKNLAYKDSLTASDIPDLSWNKITSDKPDYTTRWPKWNEISQSGAESINEGTSDVSDNTEILTSYASNNGFADTHGKGIVYRRDAIHIYNYINGKLGSMAHETASNYAKLASPAFTDTPTAPTAANGTSTTQIATTEFVNNTLAYVNAMRFKGTLGTGGTVTALPASHEAGDTYRVITAGTWAGKYCEIGTLIICTTDGTTANEAHWTSVETNEDGAVIGPTSSTTNQIAKFSSGTGRIITNSGVSIDDSNNLTVPGTALKVTSTSGAKFILMGNQDSSGANKPTILEAANGTLYIGNGTDWSSSTGGTLSTAIFMAADRKIGIGTTSPAYLLDINGTGRFSNELTLYRSSTTTQNSPARINFTVIDTDKSITASAAYIAVYNDHTTTYNSNMVINSSGNTFIGAGESASTIYSAKGSTFSGENLFLSADSMIYVYAYADTAANRVGFALDTSGNILPQKAESANSNAQNLGASNNKWANVYATTFDSTVLKLHQGTGADPSLTGNARIEFDYESGQPVVISYTPNDSYKAPAGLKIMGGSGATPAWLEVEGDMCAAAFKLGLDGDKASISSSGIKLGSTTAASNGAQLTTINGHVVVNSAKNTSNSWNEGIRINNGSNNWASLVLGGDDTTTSGCSSATWSLHTQRTDTTNKLSQFYLSYNGSSSAATRIQGYSAMVNNAATGTGFSIHPRLTVNASLDTNYNFKVSGTSLFTGTTWVQGPLRIGNTDAAANTGYATANSGSTNYISFYGVYGDGPGSFNHTYIGESIYGSKTTANEQSELLLFHGNDIPGSGPDRIRLFANEIDIQVYTAATSGDWNTIRAKAGTQVANFKNGQVTVTGDVKATSFTGPLSGDVTGNADTATQATQDSNGNTITTTYATKTEVEAIEIGGRNLLKKSHSTPREYTYPTSNYSDKASWTTAIALYGGTYTLSFWAKSTVDGDIIRVHFYNPSNITSIKGSQGQNTNATDGLCNFTLSTTWTKYWVTYTIPIGSSTRSVIIPRLVSGAGTGTVSFMWEKLEAGNKATDWSPAWEDLAFAADYLPLSGDTMTGLITLKTGVTHAGIKAGNTYINAINGNLILQNNEAIRFGTDSWDYNQWAGLKYVHSTKTISLGIADGTIFTANNAQSGGTLNFPGVSNIILTKNVGTIFKYYDTTSTAPVLQINSKDIDATILQIHGNSPSETTVGQSYGFNLKYIGTGSGAGNTLRLTADNSGGTDVVAMEWSGNGCVGIGTTYDSSYKLTVNGASKIIGNTIIEDGILYYDQASTSDVHIKYQHISGSISTTANTWYRIAVSDSESVADATGTFEIRHTNAGSPDALKLEAGIMYHSQPFIIQLYNNSWSGPKMTKARITYKQNCGGQKAYLEIFFTATTSWRYDLTFTGRNWSLQVPTATTEALTENLNKSYTINLAYETIVSAKFAGELIGNANTATSISKTGGSTANFWRGDNTWSDTLVGPLYINSTTDAGGTGDTGALIIGSKTAENIAIDTNEVMARNNKSTATLYLNNDGGLVSIGGGGLSTSGKITSTLEGTAAQFGKNSVLTVTDNATITNRAVDIKGKLNLNRVSSAYFGRISYYSPSYTTWFDYMSESSNGTAPTGGKPSTLGNVTTWAIRHLIEQSSGYGWIWESCANGAASANTVTPTPRMALSSNNGQLRIAPSASSTTNESGGLIIDSSVNGSSGNVALELWRGGNASWQFANEGGNLYIRNNWTTAKQNSYTQTSITVNYNSGNTTFAGTVTANNGFSGSLSGNATSATTATNLSAAPTIASGGTATVSLAANTAYTLTVGGKSVIFKTPADNNTATAADNILDGSNSGTAITYAPYSAQQTKLSFDTSTNAPTRTDRLNLNGSLYATTYNVAGYVTLQWNSTDSSLDFVFA